MFLISSILFHQLVLTLQQNKLESLTNIGWIAILLKYNYY